MVELRDATPDDARAIAILLVASWRAAYRGLMPDEVLAGLSVPDRERFWFNTLTAQEPRTSVVVATAAPAVVGFAAAGPPFDPADRADPALGDLYVHERRRSVCCGSSSLLAACGRRRQCRGAESAA